MLAGMSQSIPELAMLRTMPNRLRLLTRAALHQPPVAVAAQQLRAAVATTGPSPSLCRLSQWRAFHSTRARSSEKKPSFYAQVVAAWKKGVEEGEIAHSKDPKDLRTLLAESIPDSQQVKGALGSLFLAALGYVAYVVVSSRLSVGTNPNHPLKESLDLDDKKEAVAIIDQRGTR